MEISIYLGLTIILISFIAEYVDSSVGMGYGTSLTPILLIMGFDPLEVVPSILISELITGLLAAFTHHRLGNADFGFFEIKKGTSIHLKLVFLLGLCSVIGTVAAVFLAINLPKFYLSLYIGILVLTIGIVIILTLGKSIGFSWEKVTLLGIVASFNKGISGGGYGPVVTGGQLLAGINGKNAVAITSFAEGLTCIVGVFIYLITDSFSSSVLLPYLIIGAVLSVPFSAWTVKKIKIRNIKLVIGITTIILGVYTILKSFL